MDDRDDRNDRDDLAEALRELSATLNALRDELEDGARSRNRRRRQFPLRPPTPGELARFGDEVAIPALITTLEANIRALEALRRGLKIARGQRAVRDAATDAADRTVDRSSELRETTLTHLDRALRELQDAVSGDADEVGVEVDDRTRTLLEDARRLRDDIDQRLAERVNRGGESGSNSRSQPYRIDIQSGDDNQRPASDQRFVRNEDGDRDDGDDLPEESTDPGVDVDAELETLRDRYGASNEDETDESSPAGKDGDSADDGSSNGSIDDEGNGNENNGDDRDGRDEDADD
ncbi:DUF7547 family protein [Natronosalvus rutilus]|uniref:Uncharacterized protein n=1 Tax=Natronosalvus rutilus TaxID=2953753 RepID=A0A9E7SU85_9EURY|nr:hypothetical protein [Natronosalvus rutilus]UTF52587.1 hypothetical protein NGM29_12415 [Natronosalvus rutilus]